MSDICCAVLDGKGAGCGGGGGGRRGDGRGDSAGCTIFRVRCLTRTAVIQRLCNLVRCVAHHALYWSSTRRGGGGGRGGAWGGGGGDLAFLILIFRRVKECGTSCVLSVRTTSGAGIAQWLELLFQGPLSVLIDCYFGNRVIAVARKRSRSFCQKCRLQLNTHAPCLCGFE